MLGIVQQSVNNSTFRIESVSQIIGCRSQTVESGGASEYRHGSIEYEARP